jgi:hypothetical protein
LGVGKFFLEITGRLLRTPFFIVLDKIVLGVEVSPTITWLQFCRRINVLERRGFFYRPEGLLIKLLVMIGFLLKC